MINELLKNIFHWPNNPHPITLDNSVIFTLDQDTNTYPSTTEFNNDIKPQALWVIIYISIWLLTLIIVFINTKISARHYYVYFIGFSVGLVISLVDFWLKSNLTSIHISSDPNKKKSYILNTPYVQDILLNTINKDGQHIIPMITIIQMIKYHLIVQPYLEIKNRKNKKE